MQGQIENLLSKESIAQFIELKTKVDSSVTSLENLISKAVEFNATIGLSTGGYKKFKEELTGVEANQKAIVRSMSDYVKLNKQLQNFINDPKSLSAAAKATKETAAAEKLQAQARKENAAAAEKEARAIAAEAKANKESERAAQQAAKAKAAEKKTIDDAVNEYLQLSKAYQEAALRAKNYALTLGENHPVTKEAVNDAKAMHAILLRLDQSVGQSQRNVGNYKSAFDGLGMSFTQVARELPALAINTQTFILAISNNLPMVFDEIEKARKEIAALRAEGKETPSLLQRIGGAVISWQVGLSIGVALLTAYGGKLVDWVKGLFDSSAALVKAAEKQKLLNEERRKGIELNREYLNTLKNEPDLITKNLKDEIAVKRAAGASTLELLKLERQELQIRKNLAAANYLPSQPIFGGGSVDNLKRLRENLDKATATYEKFQATGIYKGKTFELGTDEYKKIDDALKNSFDLQTVLFNDQAAKITEYYESNRALAAKDAEILKELSESRIKFFAAELEYLAKNLKELSSIEELSYDQRVKARQQAYDMEKQVLEGQRREELIDARNQPNRIFEIIRDYNFREKVLAEELGKDLIGIRISYNNRLQVERARQLEEDANITKMFYEEQAKRQKEQLDREEKALLRSKNSIEEGRDILIRSELDKRNAKLKSAITEEERQKIEEKFNKERLRIEIDTNKAIIQSALEAAEKRLKSLKDDDAIAALKAQIAELKRQIAELNGQQISLDISNSQEKLKELIKGFDKFRAVADNIFSAVNEVGQIGFDQRRVEIEEETAAIDKRYQAEIAGINSSALSQEEKTQKLQQAEILYNAQKQQQELKLKQVERDRAKFERAMSIQRIIADTASAIMRQLVTTPFPAGIPFVAAITALGAAQLARVIATPFPAFAKGTDSAPGGLALVGDGGRAELVQQPDGTTWVTPNRPTVMNIPKSSIVYPDARKMLESQVAASLMVNATGRLVEAPALNTKVLEQKIDKLTNVIKNKPELNLNASKGGLTAIWKYGANSIKYTKDQMRF